MCVVRVCVGVLYCLYTHLHVCERLCVDCYLCVLIVIVCVLIFILCEFVDFYLCARVLIVVCLCVCVCIFLMHAYVIVYR